MTARSRGSALASPRAENAKSGRKPATGTHRGEHQGDAPAASIHHQGHDERLEVPVRG